MKIQIRGEFSTPELIQAIYEQLRILEDSYAVRHVRNVTLYMTPTNGFGHQIYCRDHFGRDVSVLNSDGPYRCAVESYGVNGNKERVL